ncbi:MAG: MTAP family purine nucleoside phosphorylase [Acidimicrobiia bacterium]
MSKLALIGGHGVMRTAASASAKRVERAGVPLLETDDAVWLERHGLDAFTPAHQLDHVRNLDALVAAGCDRVIALSSVGSLRGDWPVGTVVAPDDFFALGINPSRFDDARGHSIPGFDPAWRAELIAVWTRAASSPLVDGGVYAQTRGPRFETPAEVRALARDADLVGMTIASECIVAGESGLAYAAVCVVDNLANGLEPTRLTMEEYAAGAEANRERIVTDVGAVIPVLAGAR